jgi:hypothetical protein
VAKVTDADLVHLQGLAALTSLELSRTQITDAGLKSLETLTNLQIVKVMGTKVSGDGVKHLAAALPQCKIKWDGGVIGPTDTPPSGPK